MTTIAGSSVKPICIGSEKIGDPPHIEKSSRIEKNQGQRRKYTTAHQIPICPLSPSEGHGGKRGRQSLPESQYPRSNNEAGNMDYRGLLDQQEKSDSRN